MAFRPHFAREPLVVLREARPLKALFQQTVRITHLQRLLDSQLQPAARPFCRLASWREGTLLLVVTDANWATRLRYQQRRLMTALKALPEFSGLLRVVFKVAPSHTVHGPAQPGQRLSSVAADSLEQTAQTVTHPALRAALERLAQRAKGNPT